MRLNDEVHIFDIDKNGSFTFGNGNAATMTMHGSSPTFFANTTGQTFTIENSASNGGTGMFIYSANAMSSGNIMVLYTGGAGAVATTFAYDGAVLSASSRTKGTITLSSGTGTATVMSGAICACSDTDTTPVVVKCVVATTTLTASEVSGTSTHHIAYVCL